MKEEHALPTSTPEEEGIPSAAIERFLDYAEDTGMCLHSLIVVRHGKIVAEGYWKPFDKNKKHRIYSCSKSLVSIAIGLMADDGKISLDDTVISYFPEKLPPEGVHPYLAGTTIRDLLIMASPHDFTPFEIVKDMDDWTKTFFVCEPSHLPGAVFIYDTAATHVLGALVEKLSGMTFLDYMRPKLLDRLGFSKDAYCLKDPVGVSWSGSGVICTPRDLMKVALVCMQNGRFEDKQLIPEWYVKEATSRQIDTYIGSTNSDMEQGYGYQIWRLRNNAFAFIGMGGQMAVCVPEKDFMLVTTGDDQWQVYLDHLNFFNALWGTVYSSLSDSPLPPDSNGYDSLCKRLENLSIMTVQGEKSSPLIALYNEKTFEMKKNPIGFLQVRFSFCASGGVMHFQTESGNHELSFGYSEGARQQFPEYKYDCVTSAAWADDHTLNICCYIIDEYFATLRATIHFKDDAVTVYMKKIAERCIDGYEGLASGTLEE